MECTVSLVCNDIEQSTWHNDNEIHSISLNSTMSCQHGCESDEHNLTACMVHRIIWKYMRQCIPIHVNTTRVQELQVRLFAILLIMKLSSCGNNRSVTTYNL